MLQFFRRPTCGRKIDPAAGWLSRFRRHDSGTIAVIFALALLPIVLMVGVSIDYGRAVAEKTALDAYADASALLAVSRSDLTLADSDAQKDARKFFKGQTSKLEDKDLQSLTIKVKDGTGGRTAVVSYQSQVPTTFMNIVNINHIAITGVSTATSTLPTYIDFYLLLDNTPSMGIGATTSDINTMVANTSDQCAFACHDTSMYPNDYYGLAKKLGVQMRIDVMREATQQLMDTATTTEIVPQEFRMAIYTFGSSAATAGLSAIEPLTSNLSDAKTAASSIDLMSVPYQNYIDDTATDFGAALSKINGYISTPGSGSQSAPLKYLFFVSDGVADRAVGSPGCSEPVTTGSDAKTGASYVRCQEPLDLSFCTQLKDRGIKIAVLYTTYFPLPTNAWYNTWISPFSGQIATNMQNCASPGFYFEVSPSQGISEAMTALFQKAVQNVRLTQ